MRMIRLACLGYCVLLTLLLLLPNPWILFGLSYVPGIGGGLGVHFSAFLILGFLVSASQPPLGRILLAAILLSYAFGIELLQGIIPLRTVEGRDLLENLLGLLAGVAIWQIIAKRLKR